jgi:NTP pyrophosphatase (non-canonical NTP hydrolase)
MEVSDFQRLCSSIVKKIDDKYSIDRSPEFGVSQLVEELGEMAKEVNMEKLRGKGADQSDLDDEFADVVLQLLTLAEMFNVDIEKSVEKKVETLKKRHDL